MSKPDVDVIEGLSPAISIEQKTASRNPRSTVGTVTEIYDYLRLLFARVGIPYCYKCGKPIQAQTTTQMVDSILAFGEGTKIHLLAPVVRGRKGEYQKELREWQKAGFVRVKIDGQTHELGDEIKLDKMKKHDVSVFVDRLVVKKDQRVRISDSVETAVKLAEGLLLVEVLGEKNEISQTLLMSENFACVEDGISYPELEPRMFSFNSPHGACPDCDGLGAHTVFDPELVIDRELPLRECVRPWSKEGAPPQFLKTAAKLADFFDFDPAQPWKKYSAKIQKLLLNGNEEEKGPLWDGILTWLKRTYDQAWEWQRA